MSSSHTMSYVGGAQSTSVPAGEGNSCLAVEW